MHTADQPRLAADSPQFHRFSDSAEFAPRPASVAVARLHVRRVLHDWHMDTLSGAVEQVVSELTTNSVIATQAAGSDTPVRLALFAGAESILVAVWDSVSDPPVRSDAAADAENGRGLLLVEAFSASWSWKPLPPEGGGGKIIRAVIDTPFTL